MKNYLMILLLGLVMTGCSEKDEISDDGRDKEKNEEIRGEVASSFIGRGTENNPFIISNASELRKLADDVNSGITYSSTYFIMTSDIVINSNVLNSNGEPTSDGSQWEKWHPIGDSDHYFYGTFDGKGHSISGIYITNSGSYAGLFGPLRGTVKNLNIKDSYIEGSSAGAIASNINGSGFRIEKCNNYSTIVGGNVGGIVGVISYSTIDRCSNYGLINGSHRSGGIAGFSAVNPLIINSCNYARVGIGGLAAGGIVGGMDSGQIKNCYNMGTIGHGIVNSCGGIFGNCSELKTIDNCVNYGICIGKNGSCGAIVGKVLGSRGDIKNCYYLDQSYPKAFGDIGANSREAISLSAEEMIQSSFLSTLNKNATSLGDDYCTWVFGEEGLPILNK